MRKTLILGTTAFAILTVAALSPLVAMGGKEANPSTTTPSGAPEGGPSEARSQEAGNSMMAAADPAKAVFDLSGMAPGVLPFSTEASAQALAARRQVVYFFAASWCPTCRETYRDLKANTGSIPEDLVVVVVDYDKSAALKTRYGVTYQHTFILIGPGGEARKSWSGSRTIADIVKNVTGS